MAVDPQNPSTLYAFARFGPNGQTLAFLKSTEAGSNWSVVSSTSFQVEFKGRRPSKRPSDIETQKLHVPKIADPCRPIWHHTSS
jgi:hypothetical protein